MRNQQAHLLTYLLYALTRMVGSNDDLPTSKAYIRTDLSKGIQHDLAYMKRIKLANTPECNIVDLKDRIKREMKDIKQERFENNPKNYTLTFIKAEEAFSQETTDTVRRLKQAYTLLKRKMYKVAPPDMWIMISDNLHINISDEGNQDQPSNFYNITESTAEQEDATHEDVAWLAKNIVGWTTQDVPAAGVSAVITLLLITDMFGELGKAGQEAALRWLHAIDIARFIAIAVFFHIPAGLMRWLPVIVECKNYPGFQIIYEARDLTRELSSANRDALIAQVRPFLCACLETYRTDQTIDRSVWWYIHVIDSMFTRNIFFGKPNYAIDLAMADATIQEHMELRNAWPRSLWEEHAYHEVRTFLSDMRAAVEAFSGDGLPLPTRSTFFEWCVPDISFITTGNILLYALYLSYNRKDNPTAESIHFAQHACNSLEVLFTGWLRRRMLSITAVDTLFATLMDSNARDIVPALREAYKEHYMVLLPAPEEARGPAALSTPASVRASASVPADTGKGQLPYPRTRAADMWFALVDPIVNAMRENKKDMNGLFPLCMETIEPLPRLIFLQRMLRHLYDGPREKYLLNREPVHHIDIFQEGPFGNFIVYLLYDKGILKIIDSVATPGGSLDPQAPPGPAAENVAGIPLQSVLNFFTGEEISDMCDSIVELWIAQLYHVTYLAKVVHLTYLFAKVTNPLNLKRMWAINCYLNFLAGTLASQRLRDLIKPRLKGGHTILKSVQTIWSQVAQMTVSDIERLCAVPMVTPLLYSNNTSDPITMHATSVVALLRLSRFLLENTDFLRFSSTTAIAKIMCDGSLALLQVIEASTFVPVAQECVAQLTDWLAIPDAFTQLQNETEVVRTIYRTKLQALLGRRDIWLAPEQRNLFTNMLAHC